MYKRQAGVSGGADSICLLFVLLDLQKELGFELRAVHVNHQIRGADADSDQEYVETVCKELGVDLVVYKEDVPKYAEKHKLTEEEAGREVRRSAFLRQMELWGGTKIALAHHRNCLLYTSVRRYAQGIYHLEGDQIPMQVVVTKELSEQDYYWLQNLRTDLELSLIHIFI